MTITTQNQQKSVLITGCTPGGIGYALAKEFQSKGFLVVATVRNANLFDVLSKEGFTPVQLDVTSEASITACRDEVSKALQERLDILVNNAGRGLTTPATDLSLSDARAVYDTNLFGAMAMVSAFVPLLLPTHIQTSLAPSTLPPTSPNPTSPPDFTTQNNPTIHTTKEGGLIINISLISSLVPFPFGSVYSSSKAALNAYSRSLRSELAPFGIGVMVVMAGTVVSNMGKKSLERAQRGQSDGGKDSGGKEGGGGSKDGGGGSKDVGEGKDEGPKRLLKECSLYSLAPHIFARRLGWSQNPDSGGGGPMDTTLFARQLVDEALRPDYALFGGYTLFDGLGGWLGGCEGWLGSLGEWCGLGDLAGQLGRGLARGVGLGRSDWWFAGGMARWVYVGTWIGEWVLDLGAWRRFRLGEVERIVQEEARMVGEGKKKKKDEW